MEFNNPTILLTGNDELDLELLQIEISAIYIDILSSILGLTAARKAEEIIIQRAMQSQQNNQNQQQNSQNQQQKSQNQRQKSQKNNNGGHKKKKNQQQTQSNQQGQNNVQHPTPSELASIASCLGVYTILIYTRVSFIRLNELYNNIQAGTTNFVLGPNINITVGFLYSVMGNLLRAIGAIQRVEEEAQITIF